MTGWDGGYGYGIPIYGDKTLASKLNDAGKPVNLIIGGHSHTNLSAATAVGTTVVAQAHYNGRKVGRANITVQPNGAVSVSWSRLWVCAANNTASPCSGTPTLEDATIKDLITTYSSDPVYQALINTEIGWTGVPIVRDYNGDSLMGYFINKMPFTMTSTTMENLSTMLTWCSTTRAACGQTSPVRRPIPA